MVMAYIWTGMVCVSLRFGLWTGRTAEVGAAEWFLDQVPADCDLFVGHGMAYFELAKARLGLSGQEICWSSAYLAPGPLATLSWWAERTRMSALLSTASFTAMTLVPVRPLSSV